jgi:hypothetical protein
MKTAFPKDEKALLQPLKKVKSCVSTCSKSSTIDQDDASQNPKNNDDALTVSSDQSDLEIVEVNPENELSMCTLNIFIDRSQIHGHALQRL